MQKKPNRTLRKDAIHNKNIILQEARSLFTKEGIDNVSMRQIAQAAEVGQGTLYRRYAHKGELCLDLLLDIAEKNLNEIHAYLDEHREDTIQIRLNETLSYALDFVEEQCHLLSAMRAPNCEEDRTLIYHSPIYTSRHGIFRDLLEEIPRKNNSRPIDAIFGADLIMAAIAPNLFQFLRDDRGYSKDAIRDHLYHLYIQPLFESNDESKENG